MKIAEIRALAGCTWEILAAVVTGDVPRLDRVQQRVESIHAGIAKRKEEDD